MLSEEEKKAIKYFYNLRSTIDESYMLFDEEINVKCGKETIKQITLVLNLIIKLQKEKNKLRDKNQDLLRKLRNRVKEVKKLTKYSLYKKEFSRLNEIIKEKDKQIDLMAEELYEHRYQNNLNFFKDSKKARGITTSIKDIKQYFEKLAKEEGEI